MAIMNDQLDDYDYIKRAVQRITAGEISSDSGSHIMGILGKAASKFENIIKTETSRLIEA